jgi:conserved oligomeric Golgi complex subunit 2
MGRLDEGGSRGECAGLKSLLEGITSTIAQAFGPLLQLAEAMFNVGPKMDVDLLTAGVWVPIVTALMADAGIKMAIFSPGIASILQQNYLSLDSFMRNLAEQLLSSPQPGGTNGEALTIPESLYFRPKTSTATIKFAQARVFKHPKTAEFSKRWNLPIYYQLRFGDSCNRLNAAIEGTRLGGWIADVYTGDQTRANSIRSTIGFELSFFLELYDIMLGLWGADVFLQPLTNRFLRASVQIVGRCISFVKDGMDGTIKFGEETMPESSENGVSNGSALSYPARLQYCWADSPQDVAAVVWELAILESTITHDYATVICNALDSGDLSEGERSELQSLVKEVLQETSSQIQPIIDRAWNEIIVSIFVKKCSGPLAAVKGVAATYRMTNRPSPTQASPFVGTILRPLKEFDEEFAHRTPNNVGNQWKTLAIITITDRYCASMEELIDTVKKTEVALQNRRTTRRAASGGISDGDKVKLQLFLDYEAYARHVHELGVDPASIPGIAKLGLLTAEGSRIQG